MNRRLPIEQRGLDRRMFIVLSPGDVFAGYKVLGVLGSGGMGTVYRVSHPRLGREEALKTITADHAVGDGDERFRREARAAAALHHPGIVTIHEFDVTDDVPWYTMTYLDGEDLANAAGRVSVAEAGEIITRVASALDYAHGRGVVHRDIKPANVIITRLPDGRVDGVVVVDFGIARDVTVPSDLTQPFSPVGSPHYMAPEVIRGEAAGAAADQYSLAVTAFQALTGHTPFSGSTGELLAAHTTATPPSITRHRPDLAAADPVLRRALAKDPAQRYATCGDFATALSAALAAPSRDTLVPPAPVPPASIVPPASTPTPSALESDPPTPPRNRRRMAIAAATVVVVALAATITGVIWHRSAQHPIQRAEWHLPNPPGVAPGSWTSISTASDFGLRSKGITVCGIASGKLYCWGTDNSRAQLGNGSTDEAVGTQLVAGQKAGSTVSAVSVGSDYSCAIIGPKHSVTCWGTGPLNIPDERNTKDTQDTQGPVIDAVSISTSPYRACAAVTDGKVECWGMTEKLIAPFAADKPAANRAVRISALPPASAVVTTSRSTCVIETGDAAVTCHGLTDAGALIKDPADYKAFPPRIAGLSGVTGLAAAGMGETWCATTTSSVYCWGSGTFGVIGNGQRSPGPFSPTRLDVLSNPTSISGSSSVFCAAADGSAYCWGDDVGSGALGQPPGQYYIPTKVAGLSKVTVVTTGVTFACAIADGERYCWGKSPKA